MKVTLDEITDLITDGKHGDSENHENSGYYFLSSKDLFNGTLNYNNPREITKNDFENTHQRTNLKPGDILLVNAGASIGRIGITPKDDRVYRTTFQKSISVVKANRHRINNLYLYYYLLNMNKYIKNLGFGSAQPNLLISDIRRIILNIHPMHEQVKIGVLLSTYDDLIKINVRRIQILEEMAQRVYKEWFVDFRYPGYENDEMIDSELGLVPEGWGVKGMLDIPYFRFISESVNEYPGEKLYFATANILGTNIVKEGIPYSFSEKPSRAQKQPSVNTVWFARMKDSYKVSVYRNANEDQANNSILSSGMIGFQASEEELGFLYNTINQEEFHSIKDIYCTGATQISLNNDGLSKIRIIVPPISLIKRYSELANPIIDLCIALKLRNELLKITRDLLLPKLISGTIGVSELDIDVSVLE